MDATGSESKYDTKQRNDFEVSSKKRAKGNLTVSYLSTLLTGLDK
jgi:hypothetical protein